MNIIRKKLSSNSDTPWLDWFKFGFNKVEWKQNAPDFFQKSDGVAGTWILRGEPLSLFAAKSQDRT